MKHMRLLKSLAIIAFLLLPGCNNKNDLLTGRWVMDSYRVNGIVQEQKQVITMQWTFLEDGTFRQLREHPHGREELQGTWAIDAETNTLIIFYSSTRMEVLWNIINIESGLLEVNHTTPGFFVERGFKRISGLAD